VSATGAVTCGACGNQFEVGVYSPSPERILQLPGGLSISGSWLRTQNRSYLISDIVGTSITRRRRGWNPFLMVVLLIFLVAAGLGQQWVLAAVLGLLLAGLLWQSRSQPEQYVVSWVTRGGREDFQTLGNRDAAHMLLRLLRNRQQPA